MDLCPLWPIFCAFCEKRWYLPIHLARTCSVLMVATLIAAPLVDHSGANSVCNDICVSWQSWPSLPIQTSAPWSPEQKCCVRVYRQRGSWCTSVPLVPLVRCETLWKENCNKHSCPSKKKTGLVVVILKTPLIQKAGSVLNFWMGGVFKITGTSPVSLTQLFHLKMTRTTENLHRSKVLCLICRWYCPFWRASSTSLLQTTKDNFSSDSFEKETLKSLLYNDNETQNKIHTSL